MSPEAVAAMIDEASDGVAFVEDGRYTYCNRAWGDLLGRPSAAFEGRSVFDDVHPDFQGRLERWLDEHGSSSVEFSFIRADDSLAIFHLSPIRGPSRGFIARDLTWVKRFQARQVLVDRMMSVGALATGVAHEINNPLSYLLGNLNYMVEECDVIAESLGEARKRDLKESMGEAMEGAERIRAIVADLQAFARADQESLREIDVKHILEFTLNMAWISIRYRARLVKALEEVPPVLANEAVLGQAMLNLLLNAAHALPVGHASEHTIRVACRADGDKVVVEFTNSGPNIPPEVVRHVFDTFFTDTPPGIGSGLAVSIAHTVVMDMGGSITVDSEPERGTTFRVELPAHGVVDHDSSPPRRRGPARPSDTKRVLVVDDEAPLGNAFRRALRQHDVTAVTSGREAVALLTEDSDFDLIFCDLFMPDVSGMDVYAWIKNHRPGLEADIVFMTGNTFSGDGRQFLEKVSNKRLAKPFELNDLRRFVAEYVGHRDEE
ncbi:MAG: response regulator [Myxococcales bacterium]|nr:response regulator [Myxococcales bacterium]